MSIDVNNNDELSKLRGIDLQDVLVQIENTLLSYRDTLNLPSKLSFGVEIEYEHLDNNIVNNFIRKNMNEDNIWNLKSDGSLHPGGEIASPIMYDQKIYWDELQMICEFLTKKKADVLHNAGGHIHMGASYLSFDMDSWRQFLKLYTIYENIILRYSFGECINERQGFKRYAKPSAKKIYEKMDDINKVKYVSKLDSILCRDKHCAINFGNINFRFIENNTYKNTIEFRSPNATVNEIIWQNNINTFAKMMVAAHDKVMDEDFLDYKLKNKYKNNTSNNSLYNIINLNDSLEFVDLVFDNNLDKIYFLRQYLKDLNECQNVIEPVISKSFCKR